MYNLTEKILLSLLAGVAFGCSITPKRQWYVMKTTAKLWSDLNEKNLGHGIRDLNKSKLIRKIKNKDGTYVLELTDKGKFKAFNYYFKNIKIKERKWDYKWRMLIFDVPEKLRKGRNALRWKIKRMGFYELQKSVFIIPYECKEEVKFVVDFFGLKNYVNYGVLENIDSDTQLRKIFDLK